MNGANAILFTGVVLIGLLLTWLQARSSRQVAAKVLESNAAIATQTAAVAEANTIALERIHALVNSNLTTAQQGELNATRRDLASLRQLSGMKRDAGVTVPPEIIENIQLARIRIDELERELGQKHETEE